MKKTRSFLLAAGVSLVMALTFSCSGDDAGLGGGGDSSSSDATGALSSSSDSSSSNDDSSSSSVIAGINRFKAKPDESIGNDKIKYSYSYGGYDFYYIYLGELKNIPIFYQTARHFSGIDWTYKFETSNISTNTIKDAVSEGSQNAISITDEYTVSATAGIKVSTEISAKIEAKDKLSGVGAELGAKTATETSLSLFESLVKKGTIQTTTSLTKTLEHASSYTQSTMESDQWNLSRVKGDKIGYYRYTLFSASDVYLFVIKDSTGVIDYKFMEYVIPDAYFWGLDYSETQSFRKSDAIGFEFDASMLENLPKPTLSFALAATDGVSALALSSSRIAVSWNPVDGASSYKIYRSASENGEYSLIGTSDSESYTDNGLSALTIYYYKIKAIDSYGQEGAFSLYGYTTTTLVSIKRTSKEYTVSGNYTYTFNESFPATIEVYALGAGGGGQGGHRWWTAVACLFVCKGTGGAGGGGAAAYMKLNAGEAITFNISVGEGGARGDYNDDDKYGYSGDNGRATKVTWNTNSLTVSGGYGGGTSSGYRGGGSGGGLSAKPSIIPSGSPVNNHEYWKTFEGKKGGNGSEKSDNSSSGGLSGNIPKIGENPSFGGSGTAGKGGYGGYDESRGGKGYDGKVLIVVTYSE